MQKNEKVVGFDELLKGLSENYEAIYYVDFEKNQIEPYRMSRVIEERFGEFFRAKPSFEDAVDCYIKAVVSEKDREELTMVTRYAFLKEQLRDVRAFSHEYRLERDGREHVFRFKIANLDGIGELKRAVVGFADVSAEKTKDYDYYQSGHKILFVDDDNTERCLLLDVLQEKYDVAVAANGEEALKILDDSYNEIALVITDLYMPVMDGYSLLKRMKGVRQYSNIPIIVLTGGSDEVKKDDMELRCLELGASDFILKPYNVKVILNRVNSLIRLRESTTFLHYLERDSLTGLYTKEFFYQRVGQYLRERPEDECVMFVTDIIGLKVINENYGIETGDDILKQLGDLYQKLSCFLFCGRVEGDKIAGFLRADDLEMLLDYIKENRHKQQFPVSNVIIKYGYYRIRKNTNLEPQGMYDRALLALTKIKSVYGVYISEYDDEVRKDLLLQRQIVESAEKALQDNQFTIYFQPKVNVRQEKINGAEALVRWIHPDIGFMNPADFISVFEKNGFIKKLDYYVWKEVCRSLRTWKQRGLKLVPISVNVYRRDFEDPYLAESIIAIADHYQVDHSLLHVEITESSYSDAPHRIAETVHKFHDAGFVVELDDFGSGYSSMVALNDLDVDVLKLDMSIVQKDDPKSEQSVLGFSMQLARMLQLKTVAEGVETKKQAERIAALGGDYIQGYYYFKPLPKDEFEKYMN